MELVLLLTWETSLRRGLPESHLHPRMASTHTHGQSQNLSGNVKYKLIISFEAKSLIKGYIQGASKNEFPRMGVTSPQKFYNTWGLWIIWLNMLQVGSQWSEQPLNFDQNERVSSWAEKEPDWFSLVNIWGAILRWQPMYLNWSYPSIFLSRLYPSNHHFVDALASIKNMLVIK